MTVKRNLGSCVGVGYGDVKENGDLVLLSYGLYGVGPLRK